MNETQSTVSAPVVKLVTVWGAVGITSWADFASFLAALYSLLLISEWVWKKWTRPFFESHGWIKRAKRRKDDDSEATWPGTK